LRYHLNVLGRIRPRDGGLSRFPPVIEKIHHLNVLGRIRPRDGGLSRFPPVIEKILLANTFAVFSVNSVPQW
jgi:hypothetical protein